LAIANDPINAGCDDRLIHAARNSENLSVALIRKSSGNECAATFPGFDDKIVSLYARGMSTREIVSHLRELYGIEVSPDLISAVTDAVLEEVAAWQARPLEPVYPIVFFDALRIKGA